MVWDGGSKPLVVLTRWALLGVALGGAPRRSNLVRTTSGSNPPSHTISLPPPYTISLGGSAAIGISPQDACVGLVWEYVLRRKHHLTTSTTIFSQQPRNGTVRDEDIYGASRHKAQQPTIR